MKVLYKNLVPGKIYYLPHPTDRIPVLFLRKIEYTAYFLSEFGPYRVRGYRDSEFFEEI